MIIDKDLALVITGAEQYAYRFFTSGQFSKCSIIMMEY